MINFRAATNKTKISSKVIKIIKQNHTNTQLIQTKVERRKKRKKR